jgi:LuxR family maltose regulon positive regulatory protein
MLQALAEQGAGKDMQAIDTFTRVLSRAEPEGYVRLFLDEGSLMAKLLYKVSTQTATGMRDYVGRLLAAYYQEQPELHIPLEKVSKGAAVAKPLSKRELEVLRLMADGCANKEIATKLFISVGTVKRHIVHILQKLDAANRTQAVAIARELEIV